MIKLQVNHFIIFSIILLGGSLFSSEATAQMPTMGTVTITPDPYLDDLISKNIDQRKNTNTLDGYRIQIFSGSERNNANAVKAKFMKDYPDEPVYMIYQQPYFKVRVGDFRNKMETQLLYHKLLPNYGQVLVVPDKISFPKL